MNHFSIDINSEKYSLFWGDIHGHSSLSPDVFFGNPEEYYEYAKDVMKLDFCALTDHDSPNGLYAHNGKRWRKVQELAKKYYKPGKFVTFIGYEQTSGKGLKTFLYRIFNIREKELGKRVYGHRSVYFPNDDVPEYVFSHKNKESNTPKKLWKFLKPYNAITIPHHPLGGPCEPNKWNFRNDEVEPFVEIYSNHGNSESDDANYLIYNPYKGEGCSVIDALNKGYRLGFVAGTDTHSSKGGNIRGIEFLLELLRKFYGGKKNLGGGLMAVYAQRLNRESLWESFLKRRVYGTTGARIIVDFRIGEHFMGEEFTAKNPQKIKINVIGTSKLNKIEIIKNGKDIYTLRCCKKEQSFDFIDSNIKKGLSYYYIRITQNDGEMAWSSPVWVNCI